MLCGERVPGASVMEFLTLVPWLFLTVWSGLWMQRVWVLVWLWLLLSPD